MAEIVTINRETPVEFLRRNGPTLTPEIAQRYGMDVKRALEMMKAFEDAG